MAPLHAIVTDHAVTMDPKHPVLSPAYIAWQGPGLTEVRRAHPADRQRPGIRTIPGIALPGFVNTHHHVASAILTGIEDDHLPPVAGQRTPSRTRLARAFGRDISHAAAALGHLELARSGVTTTTDSQAAWHSDRRVDGSLMAARDGGLRVHFSVAFLDRTALIPPEEQHTPASARAELERLRSAYASERVEVEGEPLSLPRASDELIRALHEQRRRLMAMHLTYSRGFERWADEHLGRRAVEHLAPLGVLDGGWLFAHPLHLDDREVERLADAGGAVTYCPVSNLHMGLASPDLWRLRRAGIPIALGLDHPNGSHDVLHNAKLATIVQRSVAEDPDAWSATDALRAITVDGAAALGLAAVTGVLKAGMAADVTVLEGLTVPVASESAIAERIVMTGSREHVRHVVAGGRWLVAAGCPITVDADDIRTAALAAQRRLVAAGAG